MQQQNIMNTTALITGSSTGIGREIAELFAAHGINIIMVALEGDELLKLQTLFSDKYGVVVTTIEKDLTLPNAAEEVYREIRCKGIVVDYLINNAGFGDYSPFAESNWTKQEKMIALNITALVHLTHLFLPDMIERGRGKIMNTSSNSAFQPGPNMSIYFASKAFVLSFTEALAEEVKGTGVTVTALCPGSTKTRFNLLAAKSDIVGQNEQTDSALLTTPQFHSRDNRPTPQQVALFAYSAMMKGKTIAIHGFKNRFIVFAIRFLPRHFVTRMAKKIQMKKFTK